MNEAEYMRARASLCVTLALQMSDAKDHATLREQALRYTKRAEELEEATP